METKKFNLLYEDGAKYVETMKKQGKLFDGIVVDCTDVWV